MSIALNRFAAWPWPRLAPAGLGGISAALLATAHLFQYVGGVQPCILCLYQRYPHFAVVGLAVIALILAHRRLLRTALLAACGALYLVAAGIAAYQVGLAQGWYESGCAAPIRAGSIEELRDQLLAAPLVRCDEVSWSLFGVSLAGWNGLVSLGLAGAAILAAVRLVRWPWPTRDSGARA
jgi:disulfide bond formation protein DsbB